MLTDDNAADARTQPRDAASRAVNSGSRSSPPVPQPENGAMGVASDGVVSRLHDVDEDVAGVQVGHQVCLIRLADGSDGVAHRSVRLAGAVVQFVVETQQSQHCVSFDDEPCHPARTRGCGHL
ncbi:hypothetical protein AB0N06_08555 [Streptomyces sp. NPDC051020]|uniref:hypothetical protein n=1 Tax=Streptomyces sp. NPDC051020 TaxID=3155409 RepID=UPI0034132919